MKLSEMILHATEHDTASSDAEQILRIAHTETLKHPQKHMKLRFAAILAAALCLLVGTLYAAGVLSGFATGFGVPLASGDVKVLAQDSENMAVVWNITESWFDDYNLHIGGTVKTPDILDPEKSYKATALFHGADDGEIYYLDGTLYPNGTDTVPFVMSAPTVTDGEGGKARPGWTEEKIKVDLTIEGIYFEPENMTGRWDLNDSLVYPGTWSCTLSLTQQEHPDTVSLTGAFIGGTDEAVSAECVKLSPFTLSIDGEHLMRSDNTRYAIWLKTADGTYLLKERGMFRDNSGNWIAYDDSTPERIAVSFRDPIDVANVEAIILADDHGFGDGNVVPSVEMTEENGYVFHLISDPASANVVTDTEGEVWEMWKVLLNIPLK